MSDWILGLKKAAAGWMPGVGADDLRGAEEQVGEAFPDELGALYRRLDGGTFSSGVQLFPLRARQGKSGVVEQSQEPLEGLPEKGLWHFGVRQEGEPLFAARKGAMAAAAQGLQVPEWFDAHPEDRWIYGLKGASGELYLHPSLEQLLTPLVPPAETEEFGEETLVRALRAVDTALEQFEASGGEEGGEETNAPRAKARAPAKGRAAAAKKAASGKKAGAGKKAPARAAKATRPAKASTSKAPARKAPARKASAKAGGKKGAASTRSSAQRSPKASPARKAKSTGRSASRGTAAEKKPARPASRQRKGR